MMTAERNHLISDIVNSAPSGLGLANHTRSNLEKMSDDALRKLHAKLKLVEAHVATSSLQRSAKIDARRTALATRRAMRYERLAKLGRRVKDELPTPILNEVIAHQPPQHFFVSRTFVEPHSAVRVWNSFDRKSEGLVEQMRLVVLIWLKEFASMVIGKPDIQAVLRDVLEGPIRPEFDNYLQLACDRIGRDTLRLVRNHAIHNESQFKKYADSLFSMDVLDSLTRDMVETGFAPLSGKIRETIAIDGLAKIGSFALNYRPDVILSVSSGGKIVGDFMAAEAKLGTPQTRLISSLGKTARVTGGWRSLQACRRILLVDDIAAGTDLLCSAHRVLESHLGAGDIQMVVLASSFEARDALIQEGHTNVFVAHVAGGAVDVPWDRTGKYQMNARNHVFGIGREDALRVARAQLTRVSQSLNAASLTDAESG